MGPVAAAVAVARRLGLRVDEPVVLRAAWQVLVHLRPAPVVARVSSNAPGTDPEDVVRELDVARHAAALGAPVVEPSELVDPGPHEHDGHVVVFWGYVRRYGDVDPVVAGRDLRRLHDALASYAGELPRAGHRDHVCEMLDGNDSADADLLRTLVARELPEGQPLHGDAHLFNCMASAGRQVWHDLETACRGPREYDLAALVFRHRIHGDHPAGEVALDAYGPFDAEVLRAAFPTYAAWIAASMVTALPRRPELADDTERLLAYLRRHRS